MCLHRTLEWGTEAPQRSYSSAHSPQTAALLKKPRFEDKLRSRCVCKIARIEYGKGREENVDGVAAERRQRGASLGAARQRLGAVCWSRLGGCGFVAQTRYQYEDIEAGHLMLGKRWGTSMSAQDACVSDICDACRDTSDVVKFTKEVTGSCRMCIGLADVG